LHQVGHLSAASGDIRETPFFVSVRQCFNLDLILATLFCFSLIPWDLHM